MKKSEFLNYLRTYFTFSKGERNGIIFLMVVLLILIAAIKLTHRTSSIDNTSDIAGFQKQIDSLFGKDSIETLKGKALPIANKEIKPTSTEKVIVELNGADSSLLVKLPGIGPVFASRIIKYRNLLGGFHDKSQLAEVYGLKEENLQKVNDHIIIDHLKIQKIEIDTVGYKILFKHPYIGRDKAWKIINLRKKKANGIQPFDIEQAHIFDSLEWGKVKPYFRYKLQARN